MKDKIKEAEQLIGNGEILPALDAISEAPLSPDQKNAILSLKSRQNRTVKDWNKGLLSASEYNLESNKILNTALETVSEISHSRTTIFFDRLAENNFEINEDLVRDKNFIHAFTQIFNKVLNTKQQEKIEFFANLLSNTFPDGYSADIDEFDFDLKSLEALAFIEIKLVTLLFKFEIKHSPEQTPSATRLKKNVENWREFRSIVKKEMNLDSEQCDAYLTSIEKTGLINFPRPSVNDLRPFGANTTVLFRRLYEKISHN